MFCNFGFTDVISLPQLHYYWRIEIFSVILGAKQIVNTRFPQRLATSTLRLHFIAMWDCGRYYCRIDISGSPVASRLLECKLHHLKYTNRGKYSSKKQHRSASLLDQAPQSCSLI